MFYTLLRWLLVGRSGKAVADSMLSVIEQLINVQKQATATMDSHTAVIKHLSEQFKEAQEVYDATARVIAASKKS